MSETNDLVISTNKLTKSYDGKPVLKSLDLKVPKHSIFGFLGPNGAGKTTTIKLMLGLIRPTSGSCSVFGLDTIGNSVQIRHRIGYLAQDPHYYDFMTARETLRFTARFFYSGPNDAIESRIEETLRLVGLEDKADRPIKGYSGGERQRLGIAQAQVNNPDLLILDEPAASLDPMGRRDVLELMSKIRSQTTIFYSTHILEDVERISDIVAILNQGELVAQAPIGELLAGTGNVTYRLVVKGDAAAVRATLVRQPWVSSINTAASNGSTTLIVNVKDAGQAEDHLLRVVVGVESAKVIDFGQRVQNLEEVFMSLVEEKSHAS